MSATTELPRQAVPRREKTKDWQQRSVEAIINRSQFRFGSTAALGFSDRSSGYTYPSSRALAAKCYYLYNGIIDDDDYSHVLKPYGQSRKNFPAKLQNYNIMKPNIDILIGEFMSRPLAWTVNVENEDVVQVRNLFLQQSLQENLQQQFLLELSNLGVNVENAPPEEVQPPEELLAEMKLTYRDSRAIRGQSALNYVYRHQKVRNEFHKGFKHWIIAGEVVSHIQVVDDEVIYRMENPLNVDYGMSSDSDFICDADWAVIRRLMYASEVIDEFHGDLTRAEVDRMQKPRHQDSFFYSSSQDSVITSDGEVILVDDRHQNSNLVEVLYTYWKSRKRIGFAEGIDPISGIPTEFHFTEEDNVPVTELKELGFKITWEYLNEVWKGVRIDGDIYKRIEPVLVQRNSLNNKSVCKLPVNGIRYSDVNSPNVSWAMQMIPYQLVHNIYKYRLENAVAKAKDVIGLIDINTIPDGWNFDEWMYWADAAGIAPVDYSKEGVPFNNTHQSFLDLTAKSIESYIALLEFTKREMDELNGITDQRKGQVSNRDLKGTTEQGIIQSNHITEHIFSMYSSFIEEDLAAILDYSKIAFINNKAGSYVLPDGHTEYFSIEGPDHQEAEYGITVTVNSRQVQALGEAKQFAQAFIQNGLPASNVMDILLADNFSELRREIAQAEQAERQREAAMQEAQNAIQEEANALKREEIEIVRENNIRDNNTELEKTRMQSESNLAGKEIDANKNGIPDDNENLIKLSIDQRKESLERDKLSQKDSTEKEARRLDLKKHNDLLKIKEKELAIKKKAANKRPTSS